MISVEEYDRFVTIMNRPVKIIQTKEQEERRKAFIKKITLLTLDTLTL